MENFCAGSEVAQQQIGDDHDGGEQDGGEQDEVRPTQHVAAAGATLDPETFERASAVLALGHGEVRSGSRRERMTRLRRQIKN